MNLIYLKVKVQAVIFLKRQIRFHRNIEAGCKGEFNEVFNCNHSGLIYYYKFC